MSDRRKPYEFSPDIKLQVLRKYNFTCAISGVRKEDTPEGYLHIHHQIAIWVYLRNKKFFNSLGIDDDYIRSAKNALPLSAKEHDKIHENESVEYYKTIAIALLGLARTA